MGATIWIEDSQLELVLALLMPANRLACQVAIATGLRIGDVLSLRTEALKSRMSVREAKTGKSRRITIPAGLLRQLKAQAGPVWVFEGRGGDKPRTRQAVWADIRRAARAMRMPDKVAIGPHSMRKVYAVRQYKRTGSLGQVQRLLQHSDSAVTMLYAMADALTTQRLASGTKRRSRPR